MGGTDEDLQGILSGSRVPVYSKMSFSCTGSGEFSEWLTQQGRKQVVIIGIETHICVNQTAHHLMAQGKDVLIAADAVGARSDEMHQVGLSRLRHAGAVVAHSESIAYEWMVSAENPQFRDVLKIVKDYS